MDHCYFYADDREHLGDLGTDWEYIACIYH